MTDMMPDMLTQLADRLVLRPSTHPIDPEDRVRHWIPFSDGHLEAWATSVQPPNASKKLLALKFPGTSGRAERAGPHPCELWPEFASDAWTINPAGYGGSVGPATLQTMPAQCDAVFAFAKTKFPDHRILLTGNSLGCLSALYLAARHDVAAIYLRNPPPLRELIAGRWKYTWWNFGTARFIAARVPEELSTILNAANCKCPVFFLRSGKDRVVPEKYQRQIIDCYAGPAQEFVIEDANHDEFVPAHQHNQYVAQMNEFRQLAFGPPTTATD